MDPQQSGSGQQQPRQQPVYSLGNGGHYGMALLEFRCLAKLGQSFIAEPIIAFSTCQLTRHATGASAAVRHRPIFISAIVTETVRLIYYIVTAFSARFRPPHRTIPRTMDKCEAYSPLRPHNPVQADHFLQINQGLTGPARDILATYWQNTINHLETDTHDFKIHQLPLARIKKVMKADPEVKMISAEAPILFAKGCDIFITELTMRAWIHAEDNKRRTLQRSDIAAALAKSDMFDFLIDIVPREEGSGGHTKRTGGQQSGATAAAAVQTQQQAPQPQQQQPQQQMGPPDYTGMGQHPSMGPGPDQEYGRGPPQAIYAGHMQGPQDPNQGGYGQPQQPMFGEMYAPYGHLGGPQQVGSLDPQ
jgi:nuclear transcription factor Y, gamma